MRTRMEGVPKQTTEQTEPRVTGYGHRETTQGSREATATFRGDLERLAGLRDMAGDCGWTTQARFIGSLSAY